MNRLMTWWCSSLLRREDRRARRWLLAEAKWWAYNPESLLVALPLEGDDK